MKENYWIINNHLIHRESQKIANEYLLDLKLSNKAPTTVEKYRWVLEHFFQECPKPIEKITHDDIVTWITDIHGNKKERTIDLFLSVLSSFFKHCLAEEYIEKGLIKKRWRPKIPKSMPKYLNSSEVERVKIQAEKSPIRDRAILEFLLSSGSRRSEARNLNIEDVDLLNRSAKVLGKGNKIREVHFSVECGLLLKEYLRSRRDKNSALFINKYGEKLSAVWIYQIIRKLGKKANLLSSFSPHCCRHTFGTTMLRKGASLQLIGDALGHSDLNTTMIYVSIPSEDIIAEYNKRMGWV